jgi:hypothetical protein
MRLYLRVLSNEPPESQKTGWRRNQLSLLPCLNRGKTGSHNFLKCSYGYRPFRGAHDASHDLARALLYGSYAWICERAVE